MSTEFNPKLSEATPVTRLAYIKFMKPALRREQDAEDAAAAPADASASGTLSAEKKQGVKKSILRVAKVSLKCSQLLILNRKR